MSALSCTDDFFPDLLCCEDSEILSEDLPECSSDLESPADIEESIAVFIEDERKYIPGKRTHSQFVDSSARKAYVAWILKVQRYYGFQPLTAYLSVNYLDRFLYCHRLPESNGWPLQLLSVACLSLAAKMEEPLVPSLLDLQIEGAKFVFEPRTITRMEFLVLSVLDWKLRSITPFTFLSFFAHKLDSHGTFTGFLTDRATDIILSKIQESSFLEYWPSCIAAATILCAANDIPNFSCITAGHAESWCEGLQKDNIVSCYRLVQECWVNTRVRKRSKALPQIRVMTRADSQGTGDHFVNLVHSVLVRK
ncbi:cyclin-D1-1 isoform X2 [Daucus carota subsp. sativus]|uniref:cyclin-D1-1 isoform X2 n=1 Tax=Daucus carota subsp. sativus TaxID=79200 RepID=UPI0007EEF58C|nr:PREDICTED: cyclin-D1-1-like isoform X2 [Daucus carota subsp. sativus]